MPAPPSLPAALRSILELAHRDRRAATAALGRLTLDEQVGLVCHAPVAERARLIELAPDPEALVPALPEAELCWSVKAVGLADAGWILALATPEQIVACVDLDAWRDFVPDRAALSRWLRTLAEAGEEPLLRAAQALDSENLLLLLSDRLLAELKPNEDSWEVPAGYQTLDGQFYFAARREKDDLADIQSLLRVLFERDYWSYFRMFQGLIWESISDAEEWAARWRAGRLMDLGFPSWEESMAIYSNLPVRSLAELPEKDAFVEVGEWPLPIYMPDLPAAAESGEAIFTAMAALPESEQRAYLYAFISLANKVVVAERLPLGDAESIPRAFELAGKLASLGLEEVCAGSGIAATDVLRRLSLDRLFRVGVNLTGHLPPPSESSDEADADAEHEDRE